MFIFRFNVYRKISENTFVVLWPVRSYFRVAKKHPGNTWNLTTGLKKPGIKEAKKTWNFEQNH